MALPDQIAGYKDCYELFDKAQADPLGARALLESAEKARYFRMRMNHARVLLRRESTKMYDRTDPRHNKSEYDEFLCQIREDTEGNFWVYVVRHNTEIKAVEGLSEIENGVET